jgi:hypothetical protein
MTFLMEDILAKLLSLVGGCVLRYKYWRYGRNNTFVGMCVCVRAGERE